MLVSRRESVGDAVYEALDQIGKGSFGIVYLAEDVAQPGRRVALKTVCLRGDASGKECCDWVDTLGEARLLNALEHPHILRCHEWFVDEPSSSSGTKQLWMVLDYLDGGDLHCYYQARRQALAGPPHAKFARRIVAGVGIALDCLHHLGLVHRDVKDANILLSRNLARIVLADFGLCCAQKDAPRARESDSVVGTPSYLSPEVICGHSHSPASDAWSLGVCGFQAAALQRPFEARDDLTLTQKILQSEPPDLPDSCPADLVSAVLGLLAKDVPKRLRPAEAIELTHEAPVARLSSRRVMPRPLLALRAGSRLLSRL